MKSTGTEKPRKGEQAIFFKFTSSGVQIPERQENSKPVFFDRKMFVETLPTDSRKDKLQD